MRKLFLPLAVLTAAMFAYAPIAIANAPYESTMLLIQKIFYFHVPSWMGMYSAIAVCGVASAVYLFKGRPAAGGSLSPKWFAFFQAEWKTIGEYHKPPSREAENAATRIAHGFKV